MVTPQKQVPRNVSTWMSAKKTEADMKIILRHKEEKNLFHTQTFLIKKDRDKNDRREDRMQKHFSNMTTYVVNVWDKGKVSAGGEEGAATEDKRL
jgi:hypothetical protein